MKKILATVLVFSFILSLLAMLPAFAISGNFGILTDKTTYTQGESIMVTVKGKNSDWVGIGKYSNATNEILRVPVSYVGNGGGTFDLNYELKTTVGELAPGKYIIALIGEGADWVDTDGWRSSLTIEILPQPHLEVNKTSFQFGESVLVTARGDSTDWVGIAKYEKGADTLIKIPVSSVGSGKQFDLRKKLIEKSISLAPGKYIIALIVQGADWVDNDGWIASLTIEVVAPEPNLEVNKTTFESGESILVTARGDNTDWVGIAKFEKGSDTLIKIPVSTVGSGKQFDLLAQLKANSIALAPGNYIIALIVKGADWVDTDGWISSLTIEIKAPVTPVPATKTPTEKPTQVITPAPTANPTAVPTEVPTAVPTDAPTAAPTDTPAPTATPTATP